MFGVQQFDKNYLLILKRNCLLKVFFKQKDKYLSMKDKNVETQVNQQVTKVARIAKKKKVSSINIYTRGWGPTIVYGWSQAKTVSSNFCDVLQIFL